MCSPSRSLGGLTLLAVGFYPLASPVLGQATRPSLQVVADPNNLPFSNEKQEGFENKLAQLLAKELNTTVEFTWYAQRRGYVRNTIRYGDAHVVLGVPKNFDPLLTSVPYYRSSYVFLSRTDARLSDLTSLDDPRLRTLRLGVQLIGDDGTNTPPAHALGRRGITTNVRGYTVYSDYREPNPPARIVDAVINNEIDVALVWGPLAGFFAKSSAVPLNLTPITPDPDGAYPLSFEISVGVKRSDKELRDRVNQILRDKRPEIDALLDSYNVPRLPPPVARPSQAGQGE
jgi:mxaJ protein